MIHKIYMEERHFESFLRGEAIVIKSGSEEIHIALSDIGFDRISEMVLRAYGHRQGLPEIIRAERSTRLPRDP